MKKSFSPLYPYLAWEGEGSKSIDKALKAAERYLKEVESPERRKNLK